MFFPEGLAWLLLWGLYGLYVATVVPTSAIIALATRRHPRLRWNGSDAAALAVPFALWLTLGLANHETRRPGSIYEPFWLGVVVSILQLGALVYTWRRGGDRAWPAFVVLVLGCLAALVIWAFVGVPK